MNLNQITLPVLNVEQSIVFYEMLGLTLIVKSLPHYARFECPDGDSTFSLHQLNDAPKENGVWIYFEVEELDKRVAELITKGLQFVELPDDKEWLWRESRLKDLDNNLIILYHAGSNRRFPPWRVNLK